MKVLISMSNSRQDTDAVQVAFPDDQTIRVSLKSPTPELESILLDVLQYFPKDYSTQYMVEKYGLEFTTLSGNATLPKTGGISGCLIKHNGKAAKTVATAIKNEMISATKRYNLSVQKAETKERQTARRKADAPSKNLQRQQQKSELEKLYGKGTAARVKIRQIGGDDGYQYNVLVDGRSILNGLTRSSALHEQRLAMDAIAKKAHLGKYAK